MAIGVQVWSTTASANSTSDSNVNWAEGMAPSQVNDSARAEMASVAKFRDDNNGTIVTGGTTLAYTATTNQVEGALTDGYTIMVKFNATNDAAATLAVDGLTARQLQVIAGTNVSSGVFVSGGIYRFKYETGSTAWIAQGGNLVDGSGITTNKIADSAVTYNKIQTPSASKLLGNPSTSTSTDIREIALGTNLSFSGQTLNAGNNTPVVSLFTSTGAATWQSTTQGGNFPLYLAVRMVAGGGGGGAVNTNGGSSGTDTSFNNWTCVAGTGGQNGGSANGGTGGTGGTNGTGTLIRRLAGQHGLHSVNNQGVPGGMSYLGGAGTPTGNSGSAAAGTAATANTGGGGSGGINGGGGNVGNSGAAGEYVEFFITTPSTSYSYTVGGGGAGGSAGGQAGGNGGSGRVEVISYWQ